MPKIVMKQLPDPPPTGTVAKARLKCIEGLSDAQPLDYGHGPTLRFVFELTETPFGGLETSVMCGTALNQYSKLFKVASTVLGRAPRDGEDITGALRSAVGREFSIKVEHREGREGTGIFLDAVDITAA